MDKNSMNVIYKDFVNSNEHGLIKHYVEDCNADTSYPDYIDRLYNDTNICYVDNYIMEIGFDDERNIIKYHQIFEYISGDLIPVDTRRDYEAVMKAIRVKASDYYYKEREELYGQLE